MVRGNIRARRDHLRGPRTTFRKAFLPRPPFDLARFDMAFQKDTTPSADDNDLTNVSVYSLSIFIRKSIPRSSRLYVNFSFSYLISM